MKKYIYIVFFIILAAPLNVFAQDSQSLINNYIENISEGSTADISTSSIELMVENLEELYRRPIDLNHASKEELEKLTILTEFQIASFLDHRKKMGGIVSLMELNYIYGFTAHTVQLITPFVSINTDKGKSASAIQLKPQSSELIARIKRNNTILTNVKGDMQYYYLRYKVYAGHNISLGFLGESDAGEMLTVNNKQYGFDHYTGYIQYQSRKTIKCFIIGDYRLRIGQGLLLWPGYSTGKSSTISSVQKRGQGAKGNSSSDEYGYLRGGLITFSHKKVSLSGFVSHKNLDATIDTVNNLATSLRLTGLHRTDNELTYKNNFHETLLGTNIEYAGEHISSGLNFINGTYELPILPGQSIYNQHRLSGNKYQGISAHYKALYQRWQLFGEISNMNHKYAYLSGLNFMPDSRIIVNLTYRSYDKAYYSPYAAPFSESSSYSGEDGLFLGVGWQTDWKMNFSAYTDLFSYNWPRYQVNTLMHGHEYLLEGTYRSTSDLTLTVRYKAQLKSKNSTHNDSSIAPARFRLNSFRLSLNYALNTKLRMNTRIEMNCSQFATKPSSKGKLMYQDVIFKPIEKLRFTFRYAWFETPEYENRIYAYEHSARFVYSMPAYYGHGTKIYLLAQYNISQWLRISARFSTTNYFSSLFQQKNEGLIQFILKF